MGTLVLILLGLAALFAVLDLVLANITNVAATGAGRRYWLLPVAVLLVIAALLIQVLVK